VGEVQGNPPLFLDRDWSDIMHQYGQNLKVASEVFLAGHGTWCEVHSWKILECHLNMNITFYWGAKFGVVGLFNLFIIYCGRRQHCQSQSLSAIQLCGIMGSYCSSNSINKINVIHTKFSVTSNGKTQAQTLYSWKSLHLCIHTSRGTLASGGEVGGV